MMRFTVGAPGNVPFANFFALSPDGHRLAVQRFIDGRPSLWIRSLDSPDFQRLSGTDLVRGVFWSPDSRYIGFFAGGKLKTVPANGGPPQILCEAGIYAEGTWSRDGVILFDTDSGALERTKVSVGSGSGECTTLLPAQAGARRGHASFLPDGKHFLYTVFAGAQGGIYLGTLDAANGRRLLADTSPVRFAPRSAGGRYDHILFLRDGNLMAQALDTTSFQLVGDAFPVAGQARNNLNGGLAASAVSTGLLVYLSALSREDNRLAWLDRNGKEIAKIGMPGHALAVALSPDGKTVAIQREGTLSLLDLNRNIESPFQPAGLAAVWSPDGSRVAMSMEAKEIHVKESSGGGKEKLLLKGDGAIVFPTDWSRDGRYLLYTKDDPKTHQDLWYLENPLGPPGELKPKPFVQTEFREGRGQFSPDGRFVAYESEQSGQREVYLRQFPSGTGEWKISSNGGGTPRWRSDGKELYYLGPLPGALIAVPVQAGSGGSFQAGEPKKLFDLRVNQLSETFVYAPSADGQRFLLLLPSADQSSTLNVITNWEKAAPHP
jgi:Tol biopolymer transport system component